MKTLKDFQRLAASGEFNRLMAEGVADAIAESRALGFPVKAHLDSDHVPAAANFGCTLTLVRHGQSLANAGGLTMPHADIPLTDEGHAQAAALARVLPGSPALVLTSPFLRAQQTATPYCERTGMAARVETLLQEFDAIDPALLQGMDGAQRRPIADAFWQASDAHARMGGAAETFHEFGQRVQRFIDDVLPTLPDGTVAFGHGQWIAMLCWKLLGLGLDDGAAMRRFRLFSSGLPLHNGAIWRVYRLPAGGWHMRAATS
ncbi:MAG: histidine phosphatase family protein [Pseudomonadota bacterium]|nr:histidine phosphatase family protein [Pseudomonadota bacterium]